MPVRHFYLLPHYSCNGLFFLFSVCWLHVNEFNSFWEGLRGRGQKVVAYSDTVSAMRSMMIRWYCQLPLYTINSPLYCSNISFFSRDIFRICDKGDFFNIYIFGKWQSTFSLLLVKSEKIIFWRYIFRASSSLLISPSSPSQRLLDSFLLEPKHRKKK